MPEWSVVLKKEARGRRITSTEEDHGLGQEGSTDDIRVLTNLESQKRGRGNKIGDDETAASQSIMRRRRHDNAIWIFHMRSNRGYYGMPSGITHEHLLQMEVASNSLSDAFARCMCATPSVLLYTRVKRNMWRYVEHYVSFEICPHLNCPAQMHVHDVWQTNYETHVNRFVAVYCFCPDA